MPISVNPTLLDSFSGLVLVLLLFLLAQRWLHREMQKVLFCLLKNPALALGFFSFLFLPGVFLHEFSHFLAARLLGVRTGRFSVIPHPTGDGKIRLGYVEVEKTGILRDALIGVAPLVSGGILVHWIGRYFLGVSDLAAYLSLGQREAFFRTLAGLPSQPDFWLWFYLAFVISSMMLPSASDRRSWLPILLALGGLATLAFLSGVGGTMLKELAPALIVALRSATIVFGLSLAAHLLLAVPFTLLRIILNR